MNAAPHWHPLAVDAATLATYCDLHPGAPGCPPDVTYVHTV